MFSIINKPVYTEEQDHYSDASSYDSKARFCSYWHQIEEVLKLNPSKVIEIGIGNGFVTRYLRNKSVDITTLDVSCNLKPDVAGSVLEIPFHSELFDVVACYEVLEHLPYNDFTKALKGLSRISKKNVIISLPDDTRVYKIDIVLPIIEPIKKLISRPFPRAVKHVYNDETQHYWEIGKKGFPLNRINHDITRSGFNIIKSYRVFEFCYHRFFLLEKA